MTTPAGSNLRIQIQDVIMYKMHPQGLKDGISLMGQFMELVFYQSLFEPLISANLLLHDAVSLQYNYPLTGEEVIIIKLKQDYPQGFFGNLNTSSYLNTYTLYFVIENVSSIVLKDNAKESFITLNLISVESFANENQHISLVNKDNDTKMLEKFANKIFDDYIVKPMQKVIKGSSDNYNARIAEHRRTLSALDISDIDSGLDISYLKYEQSIGERPNMIIPNMRPLEAIKFLAKHCVGKDSRNAVGGGNYTYTFFENLRGFYFSTVEKFSKQNRFGEVRSSANTSTEKYRTYWYIADRAIINQIPDARGDDYFDSRLISNFFINSKYTSQEKAIGGYYQNRLVEINMARWAYTPPFDNGVAGLDKRNLGNFPYNTQGYITSRQNASIGTTNNISRVRYSINNFKHDPIPEIRHKWGKTTTNMQALNQFDISISVPTDINLMPGDVVKVNIPEVSPFNDAVRLDEYMSGYYLIVETKQIVKPDGTATTALKLYKDGVDKNPDTGNLLGKKV